MYHARHSFDNSFELSNVRVWIYIESIYFFAWILSGILFVATAYIWKLEPTDKDEESIKLDDNVWNDRNADDFLRYVKYDYYIFSKCLSMIIMECFIGFATGTAVDRMGPRDVWSVKYVFFLLLVSRVLRLIVNIQKMREGNVQEHEHGHELDDTCDTSYSRETKFSKVLQYFEFFVSLLVFILVSIAFYRYNYFEYLN